MKTIKTQLAKWKCPEVKTISSAELRQKIEVSACSDSYGCDIYPVCYLYHYKK